MKNMVRTFSLAAVLTAGISVASLPATASQDAQPLVTAEWLDNQLGGDDIVVLDIRSGISGSSSKTFEAAHIPGAIYTNYLQDGWRTTNPKGTPGVLPPIDQLETLYSRLGIWEESNVVIVAAGKGPLDMSAATRVYWTLKVSGHENVSILDGGFAGWQSAGLPVATGKTEAEPTFYEVDFQDQLLATQEEVSDALASNITLIDNRPTNQFKGLKKHKAAKRAGTLPGAYNIPESTMIRRGSGYFQDIASLKQLFTDARVDQSAEQIAFCNTGHWASLGWFVSHELLGNENAKLYDGSLVEWTADPKAPLSVGKKLASNDQPES